MTSIVSGLQTNIFVQNFSDLNNNIDATIYTTENFVNRTISNYLNTNSAVNINIGNGVSILNTVEGSIATTVTVGLSASISQLDDVNLGTYTSSNRYLVYDGSCWSYGPGTSPGELMITNITNVETNPRENSMLFSNNGTSMYFKEDRSVAIEHLTVPLGDGLKIIKSSSYPYKASVRTNFDNFQENINDEEDNYYLNVKPDGTTVKIKKKNIGISGFYGFTGSVFNILNDNLHATNSTVGYAEGLSVIGTTYNLNLSNYLTGSSGVLPVSKGGTNSSTSFGARVNLGLSYNSYGTCYLYDIMGYSRPEFREGMVGDNIRLLPGISGSLYIVNSGSGYNSANPYFITSQDGVSMAISITTGSGGSITSATIIDPPGGFPYIYDDFSFGVIGPGTGGELGLSVTASYINFGMSSGVEGYGIRGNKGDIEVKHKDSFLGWSKINSLTVSNLTDVTPSFSDKDFLIYNGTVFNGCSVHGEVVIDNTGLATITRGGISIGQIEFSTPAPGMSDFQNLTGTTGNLQQQIDERLYHVSTSNPNRSILVLNDPTTGTSQASNLDYDIDPSFGEANICPQVPVIEPFHTRGVSFRNIYHAFTGSGIVSTDPTTNVEVCLTESQASKQIASTLGTHDFLNFVTEETGGIGVTGNGRLQLAIEKLDSYGTCISNYNDLVAIGPSLPTILTPNLGIQIKDLLKVPIYSDVSSVPLNNYYQGALAFFTDQSGTSYLGIATGTGSCWYAVESPVII